MSYNREKIVDEGMKLAARLYDAVGIFCRAIGPYVGHENGDEEAVLKLVYAAIGAAFTKVLLDLDKKLEPSNGDFYKNYFARNTYRGLGYHQPAPASAFKPGDRVFYNGSNPTHFFADATVISREEYREKSGGFLGDDETPVIWYNGNKVGCADTVNLVLNN